MEAPHPAQHIAVNIDTWARRIEDKLDRYHDDMQRQILELQRQPDPIKDGEARMGSLELRVADLAKDVEANTQFRRDAVVSRRLLAKGWALAATLGGLAATAFQVITSALR